MGGAGWLGGGGLDWPWGKWDWVGLLVLFVLAIEDLMRFSEGIFIDGFWFGAIHVLVACVLEWSVVCVLWVFVVWFEHTIGRQYIISYGYSFWSTIRVVR